MKQPQVISLLSALWNGDKKNLPKGVEILNENELWEEIKNVKTQNDTY